MFYTNNLITPDDYIIIYNLYQAAIEKKTEDDVINILLEMSMT